MADHLFYVHLFCFWSMFGVIWVIQMAHYPAFRFISSEQFVEFHQFHSQRITPIVGPLMMTELVSGSLLVFRHGDSPVFWINFLGVIGIFIVTFAVSVPIHNQLSSGKNSAAIEKLILTNWLRTGIYSLRAIILIVLVG